MKQDRISEIDIFRGICLIGVFLSHIWFDITMFYTVEPLPDFIANVFQYGGVLFVVLSGICTVFSRGSLRRGVIVFGCGLLITAVTALLSRLMNDNSPLILFGVLHLIGFCMLLTPLLRKLPGTVLTVAGLLFIAMGYAFAEITVRSRLLFPLGLVSVGFYSADYWPVFPHLGYYILGMVLGKRLYPERRPLFPALQGKFRLLSLLGRNSLPFYLLQQPLAFLVIFIADALFFHQIRLF